MRMMVGSAERGESHPDRGEALAWKVVGRVLPTLRMIAARENLEITIEIKRASESE
jgi:hypothetical protein